MTKSEYAQLLTRPEWQTVRIRILKRDGFQCRSCKAKDCRLNVHHLVYYENKLPWEVPDKKLKTLCDKCHFKAHEGRLIGSFIKPAPKKKRKNKNTTGSKKKVWVAGKGLIDVPTKKRNKK